MSSAYHDEALRKAKTQERKNAAKEATLGDTSYVVGEGQGPFVKSIPEAQYLKELEGENKTKCKKR